MPVQLADLAIQFPASISLFEKYGFNYYQNGKQTFEAACEEKNLNFNDIDKELKDLHHKSTLSYLLTIEEMDMLRLIDFINGQHHSNEEEELAFIRNSIEKIKTDVQCPASLALLLNEAGNKFNYLEKQLLRHCDKEDKMLFPQLRKLFEARTNTKSLEFSEGIVLVKTLIATLVEEHLAATKHFSSIKQLLNNFETSENDTVNYKRLMDHLKEFEYDFHIHLHIENNVLFPKFSELEKMASA